MEDPSLVLLLNIGTPFIERYTSGARISLDNNQLTSFDRSVFEPVVNYFIVNKFDSSTTYISFFGSKYTLI